MLVIQNYTAMKRLKPREAKEGKSAPPYTVVVDGDIYVSVWKSDYAALKLLASKGEPIPVKVSARGWVKDEVVQSRADLQFVGGVDLEDDEEDTAEEAEVSVGAND